MHGITTEEIIFHSLVWGIGFAASLGRSSRKRGRVSLWDIVNTGCASGFIAFGIVTLFFGGATRSGAFNWPALGIAALIGAVGEERDKLGKAALTRAWEAGRVFFSQSNSSKHDDDRKEVDKQK
ncbi:hypothetical protein VN12_04205 [Pirellula sp. SH-Sr6A]|uniref:hypothetical protein n=1 Tax=Pirellula sp. SH-Sr6A TaxID=1632865 RepID=UPI00078B9A3A|nr:hypothetical protein [Pirellula sp. SH-Sr6A]AMV31295.1 hypothetical protein VN12_04205 [Pirellula sp. SH-Sr6A]